jgi:hypothetical protein
MTSDRAEAIALQALAWLVGDEDLLPVFLGSTGASTGDLATGATDTAFLASVLDFLLLDDAWVLRFAKSAELPPEDVMRALNSLPGAAQVHWT